MMRSLFARVHAFNSLTHAAAGPAATRAVRALRAGQLQVRRHVRPREEEPEPDLLEAPQGACVQELLQCKHGQGMLLSPYRR